MVVGIPLDGVAVVSNGQLIVVVGKGLVAKSVQTERGPSGKKVLAKPWCNLVQYSLFEFVCRLSAHSRLLCGCGTSALPRAERPSVAAKRRRRFVPKWNSM
jgi:hypothetical protein